MKTHLVVIKAHLELSRQWPLGFKIIFTNSRVTGEHLSVVSASRMPRAVTEVTRKVGGIKWAISQRFSNLRGLLPFVLTLVLWLSLYHLGRASWLGLLMEINLY